MNIYLIHITVIKQNTNSEHLTHNYINKVLVQIYCNISESNYKQYKMKYLVTWYHWLPPHLYLPQIVLSSIMQHIVHTSILYLNPSPQYFVISIAMAHVSFYLHDINLCTHINNSYLHVSINTLSFPTLTSLQTCCYNLIFILTFFHTTPLLSSHHLLNILHFVTHLPYHFIFTQHIPFSHILLAFLLHFNILIFHTFCNISSSP